jgi:hypothetical protein
MPFVDIGLVVQTEHQEELYRKAVDGPACHGPHGNFSAGNFRRSQMEKHLSAERKHNEGRWKRQESSESNSNEVGVIKSSRELTYDKADTENVNFS